MVHSVSLGDRLVLNGVFPFGFPCLTLVSLIQMDSLSTCSKFDHMYLYKDIESADRQRVCDHMTCRSCHLCSCESVSASVYNGGANRNTHTNTEETRCHWTLLLLRHYRYVTSCLHAMNSLVRMEMVYHHWQEYLNGA